jgi:hypothetical protein
MPSCLLPSPLSSLESSHRQVVDLLCTPSMACRLVFTSTGPSKTASDHLVRCYTTCYRSLHSPAPIGAYPCSLRPGIPSCTSHLIATGSTAVGSVGLPWVDCSKQTADSTGKVDSHQDSRHCLGIASSLDAASACEAVATD